MSTCVPCGIVAVPDSLCNSRGWQAATLNLVGERMRTGRKMSMNRNPELVRLRLLAWRR